MRGRQDTTAPYALAQDMAERVPGARMTTFGGGHLHVLMGERQRFADVATAFLV